MAVATKYGYGVNSDNYEAAINATYKMAEKIARQVIRNVTTQDRLALFNKEPINNGTTVEEVVVGLLEAQGYSGSVTAFANKATVNLYVKYYSDWTRCKFATTVDEKEIRKVMLSENPAETLANKITSALVESDKQDKYERLLGLFDYASKVPVSGDPDYVSGNTDPRAMVKIGTAIDLSADGGYKKLLTAIKNTISGMKFVNATFNKAGIKRATFADDIVMLMPYKVKNALDVNELAAIFNLEKDKLDARIVDVDTDGKVYIVDRNAILMLTRLYRMTSWFNPDELYMNFWLHVERMYAISLLWDCCFIEVTNA